MIKKFTFLFVTFFLVAGFVKAQVNEIKSASSSRSESRGSSSGGNRSSSFAGDFFFNIMFGQVIHWQIQTLNRKREMPSIVSLDVMLQTAAQPSSYYIINPRIRGNWGLFSTDFRFNYIVEEDFNGIKYLRTNDWQVIQLNVVNTRDVTVRIGGGVIQEAFEGRNDFPEWTTAVHVRPWGKKLGGIVEYRNSEARREINGHLHYSLFEKGPLHGYFTAGAVFQRYYESVDVWGLQAGITVSIF